MHCGFQTTRILARQLGTLDRCLLMEVTLLPQLIQHVISQYMFTENLRAIMPVAPLLI